MTAPAAGRALRATTTYKSTTHGLGQDDKDALTHPEWQAKQRPAQPVRPGRAPVPPAQPAQTASAWPELPDLGDVELLPPVPNAPQEPVQRADGASGRTSVVDHGAGFVLGVLLWAWVVLPFLKGGPAEVRKTIKAKFTNKAPDGNWLP